MMKHIRETSDKVAELIIKLGMFEIIPSKKVKILEPSAGTGKLIDTIFSLYSINTYDNIEIDCVELNKENCEVLKSKGYNTYQSDFMNFSPGKLYNRIYACPPFKGNIDLKHIKHMYSLLASRGIVVTLTSPLWILNNEEKHIEFREWLEDKDYYFKMLPDNSFMEKNKTQPTGILKIVKR